MIRPDCAIAVLALVVCESACSWLPPLPFDSELRAAQRALSLEITRSDRLDQDAAAEFTFKLSNHGTAVVKACLSGIVSLSYRASSVFRLFANNTTLDAVYDAVKEPPRMLSEFPVMRMIAALFVQPFLAGALAFIMFPLVLLDRSGQTLAGGYPVNVTDSALSVALGVSIVAGGVTFIGVLPTTLWLLNRGDVTLGRALGFGLAFGIIPYGIFAALAGGTYGPAGFVRGVAFSSLLGLAGATAFWAIALRRSRTGP